MRNNCFKCRGSNSRKENGRLKKSVNNLKCEESKKDLRLNAKQLRSSVKSRWSSFKMSN